MLRDVLFVLDQLVADGLQGVRRARAELGHAINDGPARRFCSRSNAELAAPHRHEPD